jgi:PiT family inorganic phosphate transporter
MHLFDTPIGTPQLVLLVLALFIACAFEFVNGFHDTANAVATVIYTRSLKPWMAVAISGTLNLLGVYLGGIAVAMGIIKLLPVELLAASGAGAGLAMVLSLLIAAILWNLGTWWFGLPASSSHTLIGAIIGVGLANSMMPGHVFGTGVNWHKVQEVGLSLLVSPLFGFGIASVLLVIARNAFAKAPVILQPADPNKTPPGWVRAILVATCSGVSFAHGSNDGQKGVGLIMLILIGLLPADYALNANLSKAQLHEQVVLSERLESSARDAFSAEGGQLASNADVLPQKSPANDVLADLGEVRAALNGRESIRDIPPDARFDIRSRIMRIDTKLAALEKNAKNIPADLLASIKKDRAALRSSIDYAPTWVIMIIALSLGVGTMIGWKRIVVTIGEKIGKTHLSYAQGASAELVATATIGAAGWFGWPVSTTHVLSSGVAGTMVANKSGLQGGTIRNIALAWVLTLPASILLAGGLFLLFRAIIPDAHAETTATVHFDASGDPTSVVPVVDTPLRLHGSNTIGAELAPSLAAAFLRKVGGTEVERTKDAGGHAWVVTAKLAGQSHPAEIDIDAAGSATAFEDLEKRACDIGMASRTISEAEAQKLLAAGLGDLRTPVTENVIGVDGIAVIVNPQNSLRSTTVDALAKMFDGETTSWPPGAAVQGPVNVIARDDKSGTYDTFKTLVLGGHTLSASAKRLADSEALSAAVAADPQAIGFVGMASIGRAAPIAVSDGGATAIVPSRFTVGTEDYPLTRRLYLYAPQPALHPLASQFISFAQSPEGQAIVGQLGFVDLAATEKDAEPCTSCPPKYVDLTRGAKRLSLNFRFRVGSSTLDSRGERDIARLATLVKAQRDPHVELLGFSDSQGSGDANMQLSRERAKVVADRLGAYGVTADVIEAFGDAMPVASNDSPAGRDRNRRVEVWLKSAR